MDNYSVVIWTTNNRDEAPVGSTINKIPKGTDPKDYMKANWNVGDNWFWRKIVHAEVVSGERSDATKLANQLKKKYQGNKTHSTFSVIRESCKTGSQRKTFSERTKEFAGTYKDDLKRAKDTHRSRIEKIDKRREEIQKEIDKLVEERKQANNWLEDEEERISKKYNK